MIQQLYYTTSYKQHDNLSGSYQYGGTLSLSAGNLIVRTINGGDISQASTDGHGSASEANQKDHSGLQLSTDQYPPLQE